ncbi:MAG: hypothetical protein ABJ135_00020 [Marinomonas sp.]
MTASLFDQARHHAWRMFAALILAIAFVVTIDQLYGHSIIAFALAVLGLIIANRKMLSFNCPQCDKNLFVRGPFVVLWPQRICSKCNAELDGSQNC